jgi:uncharacterized protein (DUF2252 family)
MLTLDPVRLARRQIEIDRDRTARFPHLLAQKAGRMTVSPLALLRGSAPLFYELLARHPTLAEGPSGEGWITGDLHLENFGAYRAGALSTRSRKESREAEPVAFDLNDFDEAVVGPWRFDLLRLVTSLLLGGRELGADGKQSLELVHALLDSYVDSVFRRRRLPSPPSAVGHLVAKVETRTRKELLDARTEIVRGERRFVRGTRFLELPEKIRARAAKAFAKYAARLAPSDRPGDGALDVIDAAFRVAGTGSLGVLRVAFLVRGKGGIDGGWVFDMKAEDEPSASAVLRPPKLEPAERVRAAIAACVTRPPRMMGATRLRGESMFVRRLSPQEDKLDFTRLESGDLEPLARYLGALVGSAHRRGATRPPKRPWKDEEREGIVSRAVALAGAHEATYLAYCNALRR